MSERYWQEISQEPTAPLQRLSLSQGQTGAEKKPSPASEAVIPELMPPQVKT